MELKTLTFFIVAIIFTIDTSFAQGKVAHCVPTTSLTEEKFPFKAGESLTMIFHYRWGLINADLGKGSVLLDTSVLNGVPVFHCKANGRTYKFYDNFFEVRENFQSWFTKEGLVPMRFTRNTHEGDYICRNDFSYNWTHGDEHIDANLYTSKRGARTVTLPLSKCVFDLPALYYMARNMDLSKVVKDVKYPMTFVIDDDVHNVYFIFRGKEVKNIFGLGNVHTLRFSAQLLEGEVFKGDGDMTLWITDDDNRIPVYIEAPIKVGFISARVSGYSNLKYPFKSLVK